MEDERTLKMTKYPLWRHWLQKSLNNRYYGGAQASIFSVVPYWTISRMKSQQSTMVWNFFENWLVYRVRGKVWSILHRLSTWRHVRSKNFQILSRRIHKITTDGTCNRRANTIYPIDIDNKFAHHGINKLLHITTHCRQNALDMQLIHYVERNTNENRRSLIL